MGPLPNIPLSPIRKGNEEVSSNPSITVESNSGTNTSVKLNCANNSDVELNSTTSNVELNSTTSNVELNSTASNVESNSANNSDVELNSTTSNVELNSMASNVESNSANTTNVELKSTNISNVESISIKNSNVESNSANTGKSDCVILGAIKLNIENKFLSPEEVLALMLTQQPSGKSVPGGVKENVAFVLENETNLTRKGVGKRACYVDDCGAWSRSGSCKTHHYILSEGKRLHYVDKKDGNYVKFVKGKRVVIEPQPEVDEIVVFQRYYISLKRDPNYKRRISLLTQCPTDMGALRSVAVVEYIGTFSQEPVPHGNSKKTTNAYVRTSGAVKRKLEHITETHVELAPRDIYEQMVLNGSDCGPRDLKQVQNARYNNKKHKNNDKLHHHQNIADEIQILLSEIHDHPFIQEVIQTKGKPPCVILYLEDNLHDIEQFCTPTARHPSVLGIDRTFNLGACYATTLVYQHNNLVRKGKDNAPIFLAAIYLHWDGLYSTYHRFLSHLQSKFSKDIGGTQLSKIVIGSDEEAALLKAIKQCFPSAVQVLCTRHLEENARRYLTNIIGLDDKLRKKIIGQIFGSNGLISCKDARNFELTYINLLDKFHERCPSFTEYFIKMANKIRFNVLGARQDNKWIPIDWKNNYCESMNHIIKLSSNWTTMKLPALIDRLYRIVKLQQTDCRRAIYGEGNYELASWMKKHKVSNMHWKMKTEEEKEQLFRRFMVGLPPKKKEIISTDGCLSVPRTPRIARKPGQKKRVRNIRTRTKH